MFNYIFLKHWNTRRDKLHATADDDTFNLLIMKGCDALKLSIHIRYNANGLVKHALATLSIGFKLSSECEKADHKVVSAKNHLIRNISMHGTDVSIPRMVMHLERGCWCYDFIIYLLSSY